MNQDVHVHETSSSLFVAPSKVNGSGLFSRRTIPNGGIVARLHGSVLSTANKRTIQIGRRRHICSHYIDFINHGCHPNTYVRVEDDSIVLIAINLIGSESDELTIDYNCSEYCLAQRFSCRCCQPANRVYGYKYLVETNQADYLRRINQFVLPHIMELSYEEQRLIDLS